MPTGRASTKSPSLPGRQDQVQHMAKCGLCTTRARCSRQAVGTAMGLPPSRLEERSASCPTPIAQHSNWRSAVGTCYTTAVIDKASEGQVEDPTCICSAYGLTTASGNEPASCGIPAKVAWVTPRPD